MTFTSHEINYLLIHIYIYIYLYSICKCKVNKFIKNFFQINSSNSILSNKNYFSNKSETHPTFFLCFCHLKSWQTALYMQASNRKYTDLKVVIEVVNDRSRLCLNVKAEWYITTTNITLKLIEFRESYLDELHCLWFPTWSLVPTLALHKFIQ